MDWKAGLEDVVAGRSAICRVQGEEGRLFFGATRSPTLREARRSRT